MIAGTNANRSVVSPRIHPATQHKIRRSAAQRRTVDNHCRATVRRTALDQTWHTAAAPQGNGVQLTLRGTNCRQPKHSSAECLDGTSHCSTERQSIAHVLPSATSLGTGCRYLPATEEPWYTPRRTSLRCPQTKDATAMQYPGFIARTLLACVPVRLGRYTGYALLTTVRPRRAATLPQRVFAEGRTSPPPGPPPLAPPYHTSAERVIAEQLPCS